MSDVARQGRRQASHHRDGREAAERHHRQSRARRVSGTLSRQSPSVCFAPIAPTTWSRLTLHVDISNCEHNISPETGRGRDASTSSRDVRATANCCIACIGPILRSMRGLLAASLSRRDRIVGVLVHHAARSSASHDLLLQ
jgi:hypothetical protein